MFIGRMDGRAVAVDVAAADVAAGAAGEDTVGMVVVEVAGAAADDAAVADAVAVAGDDETVAGGMVTHPTGDVPKSTGIGTAEMFDCPVVTEISAKTFEVLPPGGWDPVHQGRQ